MIKFEVGQTYVSTFDYIPLKVVKRTKNTITFQDKIGLEYKRYLNSRYTEALQCEWVFIDNFRSIIAIDIYREI